MIPLKQLRLTYGRQPVPPVFYSDNGKLNADRFARLFEQGSSLIIVKLDEYVPAIAAVCQDARKQGVRVVGAGVIGTTGNNGALKRHFDFRDLVLLQVEGRKRWRVFGPPVPNPVRAMVEQSPPEGLPVFDAVLEPGHILFLPAGYWHECDNASQCSLHLGLFLDPPTASET